MKHPPIKDKLKLLPQIVEERKYPKIVKVDLKQTYLFDPKNHL